MMTRKAPAKRRGAASLEVVLATVVALPLCAALLFFAIAVCRYAFAGLSGPVTMPFL
ncbi:MAG: hypothetical protein KDA45_07045 [Planctomycetales bacterium]|nr:hypothetical protein [Planctomycetales bacterium]